MATFQQSCDVATHQLTQDVEMRWNSTYLMLQRLSEQQKVLNLFTVEKGRIDCLMKSEWELVNHIVAVRLQPFYDATLEISRDDACISIVIALVRLLTNKLQSTSKDHLFYFIKTQRAIWPLTCFKKTYSQSVTVKKRLNFTPDSLFLKTLIEGDFTISSFR